MPIVTTVPNTNLSDVFVLLSPSPSTPVQVSSDVVGVVGEANRGPLDLPTWFGGMDEFTAKFGLQTPDISNTTAATQYLSLFMASDTLKKLGVKNTMGVRVANSYAATAYLHISNGTGKMIALHAGAPGAIASPGTWANSLEAIVTAGVDNSHFNMVVKNLATNEQQTFANLPISPNSALISAINNVATLVVASQPVVDVPAQPTFSGTGSAGTGLAGQYYGIVTYTNAAGETIGSPESAQFTITSTQSISVTVPTMAGATGANIYLTAIGGAKGTETFAASTSTLGSATLISAVWSVSTKQPPVMNTALTGAGDTSAVATAGTFSFPTTAGTGKGVGNDGAGASAARYLGAAGAPSTGANAFAGLNERPNFVLFAGKAGTTISGSGGWADQAALAHSNAWFAIVGAPQGTSDTSLESTIAGMTALTGSSDADYIKVSFPWAQRVDPATGLTIVVPSAAYLAGITALQAAHVSAANKPLSGAAISAAEFPLSDTQCSGLISAGVCPLTATIPASGIGYKKDLYLSTNRGFLIRKQVDLATKMLLYGAPFVEQPNNEQLWQSCEDQITGLFELEAAAGNIPDNPAGGTASTLPTTTAGGAAGTKPSSVTPTVPTPAQVNWAVICDATTNLINNQVTSTLYCKAYARIAPNVEMALFTLTAGPTVTITPLS